MGKDIKKMIKRLKGGKNRYKKMTAVKAIVEKCIDCCGGSKKEVELCPVSDCPLWYFRMGDLDDGDVIKVLKNPNPDLSLLDDSCFESDE